jgi:hypothetical protein
MASAMIKLVMAKLHQGSAVYKPIAKHAMADNKMVTNIFTELFFIILFFKLY